MFDDDSPMTLTMDWYAPRVCAPGRMLMSMPSAPADARRWTRRDFRALYKQHAAWCEPAKLPEAVCRDRDADWVLAAALAGEAEAMVTGDADLLTLGAHSGVAMISPRQFLGRQSPSTDR